VPTHEQVVLANGVAVDAGMASLVTALWELGLRTSYSCQGTPDEPSLEEWTRAAGYILFPEAQDAIAFFNKALGAASAPEHWAHIVIEVRHLSTPTAPYEKRGPAVTLELSTDRIANKGALRGCVRFDPKLLPAIEAVFALGTE
jgi:hypothetical protein